jgi:flagellar motor switch protein FliN/FliY
MAQTETRIGPGDALRRRPISKSANLGEEWDSAEPVEEKDERDRFRGFLDLPLEVGVQLGRRFVRFQEVLDLQVDSVIRIERSAGENVDLLLENQPIGKGEIVVIEDLMGLRITDLTRPEGAASAPEESEDA